MDGGIACCRGGGRGREDDDIAGEEVAVGKDELWMRSVFRLGAGTYRGVVKVGYTHAILPEARRVPQFCNRADQLLVEFCLALIFRFGSRGEGKYPFAHDSPDIWSVFSGSNYIDICKGWHRFGGCAGEIVISSFFGQGSC